MKEKIAIFLLLLTITAALPIAAVKCGDSGGAKQTVSTSDAAENPESKDAVICALTAAVYKESYCTETVKAIAIIMSTDYAVKPESFEKEDFLYENVASGSVKEVYEQIEQCVSKAKNTTLRKNGKALFVPYADGSNGVTYKSDSYSYIHAVASPWDCYIGGNDENTQCVGVSLSGVNYLCENGCSAEDALLWYLPGFEIETEGSADSAA